MWHPLSRYVAIRYSQVVCATLTLYSRLFAGDAERKIVIGTRFGPGADGFPLKFVWYEHGHPVGFEGHIELNEGDLYIMSSKAVWFDKRATLRLMHAAGKEKYTIDPKHLRTGQSFPPVLSLRMPWTEWAKGRLPQNGPMDAFLSKRKLIERGGDGDDNADPGCDGNGDGNAGDEVKCVVCDNRFEHLRLQPLRWTVRSMVLH